LDIFEKYSPEINLVESMLTENGCAEQPTLDEICKYQSNLKGKRFRPLVVILSYKFVGGKNLDDIISLATGIELIHTATLIHDDMNDKSKLRRGRETVYSKYGMARALILGDYLFALGFKLGGSYGKRIVEIVAELSLRLAEGEFIHIENSRNPDLSEDIYFDIIERKTAGPIMGGAKIGGVLGEGSDTEISVLGNYGKNIGMAFQIIDDIFDITGTEGELGKPVGVDLKNGKITLLLVQALKELDQSKSNRLRNIVSSHESSDEDFAEAVEIIQSTSAVNYAKEKAKSYIDYAQQALTGYEDNEFHSSLMELAKYTIERKS